jgi:LemA protein
MIWVALIIISVIILWVIIIYNGLISLKNQVAGAWSQIDVQLKRRHDLIPNLVSVVKGYMEYERDTLQRVIAARTRALAASGIIERAEKEGHLTDELHNLFAVMENYPVLKSNVNALELQEELASTENKIAFSRQFYNDLVANYSIKLESFPNNIVASVFGFRPAEYFRAEERDRKVP